MRLEVEQQLAGHFDADLPAVVPSGSHSLQGLFCQRNARNLVMQELGMPRALEWQDSDHDRHRDLTPEVLEETQPDLDIVDRLGHHEMRAGGQFLAQPARLQRQILPGRIDCAGDREGGISAERRARPVDSLIHLAEDFDQADRIDVVDGRRIRVIAQARRIAGKGQDIANSGRMRAE